MTLGTSITAAPIPHDKAMATDAAAAFGDHPAEVRALIGGAAGCSGYLRGLIGRERDWLNGALDADPATTMAGLIAQVRAAEGNADAVGQVLRRAKGQAALLIALADLGGAWPLGVVTAQLTGFADACTDAALGVLLRTEAARGKLPGLTADDAAARAGIVALAMGKMGAGELNYSSDIDLIMLFDAGRHDPADFEEIRSGFVRITRRMGRLLSDVTAQGYVFRTDFRLRPDPGVTPVCISTDAAERYYESQGRTWERAAFIKARAAAGDIGVGGEFLATLRPFVYRRHLDFAAIEDAHGMRLRIREAKSTGGRLNLAGHNVKLGRGGIREIEFFAQTQQLIAGGRDEGLRVRGTCAALDALVSAGKLDGDARDHLQASYRFLRTVEHRLQMIADAQTHSLPQGEDGFARLAAFMGEADAEVLKARLADTFESVHATTEAFFAPATTSRGAADTFRADSRDLIAGWSRLPVLRSERAQMVFGRIEPALLSGLARAADPDGALRQFDRFMAGLPAGVQLFSLFEANPQLIDLIAEVCAVAPSLAQHLAGHAGVLDAVLDGGFFAALPDEDTLSAQIAQAIKAEDDYERQLDAARRVMHEEHFRIGVHYLRGLVDSEAASQAYSRLAGAVLAALWPAVVAEFARRHGPLPGRGAILVGMGSLGARAMTPTSDLDLLLIYDAAGATESAGPRPLAISAYFARLTQALVTALSTQTAEGRLYEVDMRLRPSGRKGPVAVAWSGFGPYQMTEAWTWEHLALTRARAITGEATLAKEFEALRRDILVAKSGADTAFAAVADMLKRLRADEGSTPGAWEVRDGPGRLRDISLLAQATALHSASPARRSAAQIAQAVDSGRMDAGDASVLTHAHDLMRDIQMVGRLTLGGAFDPEKAGEGGRAFLLRLTGETDLDALAGRLADAARASTDVIRARTGG